VILAANLLSGRHGSLRWETVTAVGGWTAGLSAVLLFFWSFIFDDPQVRGYLLQLLYFSFLMALSRDYAKILKPLFDRFTKRE
jgi:hypothetical protein